MPAVQDPRPWPLKGQAARVLGLQVRRGSSEWGICTVKVLVFRGCGHAWDCEGILQDFVDSLLSLKE